MDIYVFVYNIYTIFITYIVTLYTPDTADFESESLISVSIRFYYSWVRFVQVT